jgi:hypothetical protein
MTIDIRFARRAIAVLGLTVAFAVPAGAQAAGTTTGAQGTVTTDTVRTEQREEHHFPWGLLGLLGLAGLLKRPQRETVVQRDPAFRDPGTTGRI